jgi:hypothetical protein
MRSVFFNSRLDCSRLTACRIRALFGAPAEFVVPSMEARMRPPIRRSGLSLMVLVFLSSATLAQGAKHIPKPATKQTPNVTTFGTCAADGVKGDPAENHLKNRTDTATSYTTVAFSAFTELADPTNLNKTRRGQWKPSVVQTIHETEGVPVALEGFLAVVINLDKQRHGARPEGAEATNCGKTSSASIDWHLWVLPAAGASRANAVVAEITPRIRAKHAGWLLSKLDRIAHDGVRVRVSGWSLFDPDHPEQLKATRVTLWEIHPITRFEVNQNGSWVPLDTWKPAK